MEATHSTFENTKRNNVRSIDPFLFVRNIPDHTPPSFNHAITTLTSVAKFNLLTSDAIDEMMRGTIPNLKSVCYDLYKTFYTTYCPYNALQFMPVLQKMRSLKSDAIKQFKINSTCKHVLVQNDLLKVVLIHWRPGDESNIHGHAKGGCVFKVLHGSLNEKRYSIDNKKNALAESTFKKDGMAYIDDSLAYHSVGNPFKESAISLHVYTPGHKQ